MKKITLFIVCLLSLSINASHKEKSPTTRTQQKKARALGYGHKSDFEGFEGFEENDNEDIIIGQAAFRNLLAKEAQVKAKTAYLSESKKKESFPKNSLETFTTKNSFAEAPTENAWFPKKSNVELPCPIQPSTPTASLVEDIPTSADLSNTEELLPGFFQRFVSISMGKC